MIPFDFATFLRMFRLAFRDRMSSRRKKVVWSLVFLIPTLAAVNTVCLALDRLLFPGFRKVSVRAPVFIVGHARSGTTLMHRLMTGDERMSWFMTYELFLPSILQKKLARMLGTLDRRLLGGAIDARIRRWEDRTFAKGRQMHPMSLTGPEEDEFVLAASCMSGVWVTVFPYMRELDYLYYVDEMPAARRRRIIGWYRALVQRQVYVNGASKTHCSKNPTFSGKMESLIEAFPDARFVVMNRTPYETIPSLLKMMERNWKASDCDRERMRDSLRCLADQSFHTYKYPYEVLARHPHTRRAIVDYRELVEQPKHVAKCVYEQLGIVMTDAFSRHLDQEQRRSQSYRAEHVYSLGEYGLEPGRIRSELGELFERFGWDLAPPADDSAQDPAEARRAERA